MPPRQLGHEESRNLRPVGKRFVVNLREARDDAHCLLRGDIEFGVVRAEMVGHCLGVIGLVEFGFAKPDGECLDRPAALRLHQRDYGG